ncbi:MAG: hypothetical protein ACYSWO_13595 [Planctomycetota bacterium]|jgi:hypothetical protein
MKKNILTIIPILLGALLSGCGVPVVDVDVKPRSCPNPLNVNSKGVLPVAVLGTDTFDVLDVDVTEVKLLGVEPIMELTSYEDVSTPVEDVTDCECTDAGPDGYLDLVLHFDTQEVAAAMEALAELFEELEFEDGELFPLILYEGEVSIPDELYDVARWGGDCVVIRKKGPEQPD